MRIFVAGLSKSGKTTRSQYAADCLPEAEYVSISQLLRVSGGILPVSTLAEALANQQTAAEQVLAHPRSQRHQIIDGHALIETPVGPLLVPDRFFEDISPDLLIHIQEAPQQILARRSPEANSLEEITALIALEQAACERLAAKLHIPLLTLLAPTQERFRRELEAHLLVAQ